MKKRVLAVLLACVAMVSLAACGGSSAGEGSTEEKGTIKLGCMSIFEPYMQEIKTKLDEKGYKTEVVLFDANNMAAIATKDGSIDGFIHNHLPWINTFNEENNCDLKMIEPYLGYYRTAMYSSKYKSVEELPNGATIAFPNDPTNVEKSLEFMQELGLLKLGEKKDAFYTPLDVVENTKNIQFVQTEISVTARSINDADAVICPATRIKQAGIDPNVFLAEDKSYVDFPVGLTVAPGSVDKQWVQDAMEIIQSDEMRDKFNEIFEGTIVLYEKK